MRSDNALGPAGGPTADPNAAGIADGGDRAERMRRSAGLLGLERMTGIEPAFSAWEFDRDPASALTGLAAADPTRPRLTAAWGPWGAGARSSGRRKPPLIRRLGASARSRPTKAVPRSTTVFRQLSSRATSGSVSVSAAVTRLARAGAQATLCSLDGHRLFHSQLPPPFGAPPESGLISCQEFHKSVSIRARSEEAAAGCQTSSSLLGR